MAGLVLLVAVSIPRRLSFNPMECDLEASSTY
jgi:hypothetical protein